jgi:hypothetical protein
MRTLCTPLAALFFLMSSIGQIVAQSPTSFSLVRAGRMIDPRSGNVLSPAAVLIEDGRIKQVGLLRESPIRDERRPSGPNDLASH